MTDTFMTLVKGAIALLLMKFLEKQGTFLDLRVGGSAEGTLCRLCDCDGACKYCIKSAKLCLRGGVVGSVSVPLGVFVSRIFRMFRRISVSLGYRFSFYAQACYDFVDNVVTGEVGGTGSLQVFVSGGSFGGGMLVKQILKRFPGLRGIVNGTRFNFQHELGRRSRGPIRGSVLGYQRCNDAGWWRK